MRYETERTGRRGHPDSTTDARARGLGVFSIALGLMEVAAPRALARFLGMEGSEALIRGYGLREIATGVGILASHDPTPWVWGRVAGDGLDIGTVALASSDGTNTQNKLISLAALAGVTALDVYCAMGLEAEKGGPSTAVADYRNRSGFPQGAQAARGAAKDF